MNEVDPRIRERRTAVEQAAARRRSILVASGAGVLALIALTWFVLQSSLLEARDLEVEGVTEARAALIVRRARLPEGSSLPLLDTGPIAARIRSIPWVGAVEVTKDLPHAVRVRVVVREPVAFARSGAPIPAPTTTTTTTVPPPRPSGATGASGTTGTTTASTSTTVVPTTTTTRPAPPRPPRLVDARGRVLETTAEPPAGLPEILGARVPRAGRRIRPAAPAVALAALPVELRSQVVRVTVDTRGTITLELLVPPGTRRPPARRVRLGSAAQARAKGEAALAVLRSIVTAKGSVGTIDVSVPSAPVTTG